MATIAAPAAPASSAAGQRWNLRGLSVVSFGHGLNDFYSGIVPFAIFLVLSRDHVSAGFQGLLVFVWYLTSSIVQPLFGAYTDRHGRWWFMPAAIAVSIVAICLGAATSSIAILTACIVAGGIGSALMHPEAGKYSAMLSGSQRASGISIFQIGGQIGYAIGPAVLALLYARFGSPGSLLLLVPGAIAVAVLFALMPRVDRAASRTHAEVHKATPPSSGPVDRTGVSLLISSTALRQFVSAAFMTYLPNLLVARGDSIVAAGQIVTAFLIVAAIGMYAGGSLGDRFGAVRVSVLSLVAAVPCLFAFFVVGGSGGVLLLLGASVLLSVQNAPGVAIVQAMLPKNLGMALGLMNGVAFGIGSGLVAVLGSVVATAGCVVALESVSAMPLLAACAYAVVGRRMRRSVPSA